MFEPIQRITGVPCVLDHQDIDTDRIIPARFLTTIERDGLGEHLFRDWRDHEARVASALAAAWGVASPILIAGANFGCGSSREHAVWALMEFGFRCVIAPSFADIFEKNAFGNGFVPVRIPASVHAELMGIAAGDSLEVDIDAGEVRSTSGWAAAFELPAFERRCLRKGWDALDFLVDQGPAIERFESVRV